MKKKSLKRILWIFVIAVIVAVTWFAWPRLPIITAFAAKGMCSSVFLAGKDSALIQTQDLSFFPISLAKSSIDYEEKSVTSTVFGLAKRKAIYREGLGSVIVLDTPIEELKQASFNIPEPGYSQDTLLWPTGTLISGEMPAGVDYERLKNVVDTCFDAPGAEPSKKSLAIVLVYDGQIIAEKYLGDYDYHTPFHGWSMTKSVAGAMAGILYDEGKLSLDEQVQIDEWQND